MQWSAVVADLLSPSLQTTYSTALYGAPGLVDVDHLKVLHLSLLDSDSVQSVGEMGLCSHHAKYKVLPFYYPHHVAMNGMQSHDPMDTVWVGRDAWQSKAAPAPSHSWVEVTHCSSGVIGRSHASIDNYLNTSAHRIAAHGDPSRSLRRAIGPAWFYVRHEGPTDGTEPSCLCASERPARSRIPCVRQVAPGSGVLVNVGRTRVVSMEEAKELLNRFELGDVNSSALGCRLPRAVGSALSSTHHSHSSSAAAAVTATRRREPMASLLRDNDAPMHSSASAAPDRSARRARGRGGGEGGAPRHVWGVGAVNARAENAERVVGRGGADDEGGASLAFDGLDSLQVLSHKEFFSVERRHELILLREAECAPPCMYHTQRKHTGSCARTPTRGVQRTTTLLIRMRRALQQRLNLKLARCVCHRCADVRTMRHVACGPPTRGHPLMPRSDTRCEAMVRRVSDCHDHRKFTPRVLGALRAGAKAAGRTRQLGFRVDCHDRAVQARAALLRRRIMNATARSTAAS